MPSIFEVWFGSSPDRAGSPAAAYGRAYCEVTFPPDQDSALAADIHETEIDGVPCFWVESGRPTLSAQLTFRQGMADEPFAEGGWLHLLEHLALHGRGGGALQVNGSVSVLTTEFSAHGPIEQVAQHLSDVSGWLAQPGFDGLAHERDVLRAESRLRGGPASRAFSWRYGAQGPGLVGQQDPGLGRADAAALSKRASEAFTVGNAALALDGPPPAGLRLALPPGGRLAVSDAEPVYNGPAAYIDDAGLVLSGVVRCSDTALVAAEVLRRALTERLREGAGGAYAPWATYERVDNEHALVVAGSDMMPSLLPEIATAAMRLKSDFTNEPVPTAWLDEITAERAQQLHDPHQLSRVAFRAAILSLFGQPPESLQEMIEKARRVDTSELHGHMDEFFGSLLVGLPGETSWKHQLPMLDFPNTGVGPRVHQWRHRNWPANPAVLSLDTGHLVIREGTTTHALALAEVAGVLQHADGARQVVARDGWTLLVDPRRWLDGPAAVAALDYIVPAALHLPHPAREDGAFVPVPWRRRWWLFLRQNLLRKPLVVGGLLLALCFIVLFLIDRYAPAMYDITSIVIGPVLVIAGFTLIWRNARRDSAS